MPKYLIFAEAKKETKDDSLNSCKTAQQRIAVCYGRGIFTRTSLSLGVGFSTSLS
jgi:hypothetical protein